MQKDVDQRVFVNPSLHTDGVVVVARHPTPKDLDCKETSKTSRKQHHHAQTPGGHVPALALPAYMVGLPRSGSPYLHGWAAQLWLFLPTWLGCPTLALPAYMVGLFLPTWLGCPTLALPADSVGLPNSGSPCLYGCRRAESGGCKLHTFP